MIVDPVPSAWKRRLLANTSSMRIFPFGSRRQAAARFREMGDCRFDLMEQRSNGDRRAAHRTGLVSGALVSALLDSLGRYVTWRGRVDREGLNSPGLTISIESVPSAIT